MKTRILLIAFVMIGFVISTNAQSKTKTLIVQTSAKCDDCKERIEYNLGFAKGVQKVTLDLETKKATVVYNSKKTTEEKIKIAITKIGYAADDMKAVKKAHDKLPECCQSSAEEH